MLIIFPVPLPLSGSGLYESSACYHNLSELIYAAPPLCLENTTSLQFSVTFVSSSLYASPFRRVYCQNRYTQSNRPLTNWGDGYLEAETMLTTFDSSFIYSHNNIMVSAHQIISLLYKKNEKTIQSPSSYNQWLFLNLCFPTPLATSLFNQ